MKSTTSGTSSGTAIQSRRSRAPQVTTCVFGILFSLVALLWCVGGAGIYGSPLPAFGSEGWIILSYVAATAGSSFLAALTVFAFPVVASRILQTGAAIGCLLGGRYLFAGYLPVDPVAAIFSFGIPGILLLLGGWVSRTAPSKSSQRPDDAPDHRDAVDNTKRTRPIQTSLRQLLLYTTVVALALAFGKLSEPPSTHESEFLMDYSWSIPVTHSERYQAKQDAGEDLRSILRKQYQVDLLVRSGSQTLARRPNRHRRRHGGGAGEMPASPRPLIEDLRAGLKDVLAREGIEILNELDRSGLEPGDASNRGFSILYRTGDRKGLIQAMETDHRDRVVLTIRERPSTNLFTVYPERYQPPHWESNWSQFE